MSPPLLLKLGGSVLTGKRPTRRKDPYRAEVGERLAREIASGHASLRGGLVVVHGGGLYGHPEAERHGLPPFPLAPAPAGVRAARARGVVAVQARMQALAAHVTVDLSAAGLPVTPIPGHEAVRVAGGRVTRLLAAPVERHLSRGRVPLLWGDAAADDGSGGGIVGGDTLVELLSVALRPSRVLFVTDVDGLLDRPPGPKASVVRRVAVAAGSPGPSGALPVPSVASRLPGRSRAASSLAAPRGTDVTGGIGAKLAAASRIAAGGAEVVLLNGLVAGRLAKAIRGEPVVGTVVSAREA